MAKLRKGVSYRTIERPYTRYSKYRKHSFIRATPNIKIVRFDMGSLNKQFPYQVDLLSREDVQIRQESIEAARKTCNRYLEKNVGKANYHLQIRMYPFHVLRENPIAQGAGADRFSTGMSHPYGKPIGVAAQITVGHPLFTAHTNKESISAVRMALRKAKYKLPCVCTIQIIENK